MSNTRSAQGIGSAIQLASSIQKIGSAIQEGGKNGYCMFKFFQLVKKELEMQPRVNENISEIYRKLMISMSSLSTGLTFILARNSANVQNNKLADLLCLMLSVLTYIMVNNKLTSASLTKDLRQILTAFTMLNASKAAQLSIRKSIGYFSSPRPAVTREEVPQAQAENLNRSYPN